MAHRFVHSFTHSFIHIEEKRRKQVVERYANVAVDGRTKRQICKSIQFNESKQRRSNVEALREKGMGEEGGVFAGDE